MTGLLIAGTSSDAGKSLIVAGLCRAARRRGIDVAPFKAQNMSNNSMVCADGSEIGRAQYLQAQAAGVTPSSLLNPVLLKPGTDRRAHVVLRGQPAGQLVAGEYATGRRHLAEAAFEAYRELSAAHELIIVEGAGSPAEINLRQGDYVNFGLAREFDLPVVVVSDIDRGGALASLFGTWAIVDEADRQLLVGYIINKFRGDESVLAPGLAELTRRTGLTNFGVLNWLDDVWLDGEDALTIGSRPLTQGVGEALSVAVVRLPRTSNATDVDALAAEPGVQVNVTTSATECAGADLVILPGSRATTSDLAWLRQRGIDDVLRERAAAGRPILGICGGYQMLTARIEDNGIEGASTDGLGLLSGVVRFGADKVLGRPTGSWRGEPASGYTIHHGVVHRDDEVTDFLDGEQRGAVFGTMWHGAFEEDGFRRAWLAEIARFAGVAWQSDPAALGFAHRRELMLDRLADAMAEQLDLDALLGAAKG